MATPALFPVPGARAADSTHGRRFPSRLEDAVGAAYVTRQPSRSSAIGSPGFGTRQSTVDDESVPVMLVMPSSPHRAVCPQYFRVHLQTCS